MAKVRIARDALSLDHAIISSMARILALLIVSALLGSCSSTRNIGDYIPHWAGGLPQDAPPRPGTPEYEAFRQKQDAEAARDKSKDSAKPKVDASSAK